MKNNNIIYVDIDGTIIDIVTPWVKYINKKFKKKINCDEITEYDIRKLCPDIPESQLYKPLTSQSFWQNVEPIKGSEWGIKKLQQDGYDVFAVTSTDYRNIKYKMEHIIHRLFPSIDDKHVIFIHHKNLLNGLFMIDDYPENLRGGEYGKILIDRAYNSYCEDEDIIRASTWIDVVATIERSNNK